MPNIAHTYYPQSGRLVILGAGESGVGAAILGKDKGFDVFVSDMGSISDKYKANLQAEGIAFEEGQHSEELILNAALVVKSPGIPEKAPMIKKLRANHGFVTEIRWNPGGEGVILAKHELSKEIDGGGVYLTMHATEGEEKQV